MDQTLYDHLGGRETITGVVAGLYERLLSDDLIAPIFAGVDVERLRHHMTTFLSAALGSENVYVGRDMVAVLESAEVGPDLVTHVRATVAPLRAQVVHGDAVA